MANVFVSLISPAGNGVGPAVDTSGMGGTKTIVVGSSGGVYEPVITIEVSNDGGNNWSPIGPSFNGPNALTVVVSAALMRMNVSRFIDGVVPSVDIGAIVDTVQLGTLLPTAGNGISPAVDTSAFDLGWSVQVVGAYMGTVNIEISEDGGVTWATAFTFRPGGPTLQSAVIASQFTRVERTGVPVVSPGLPVVIIAATASGSGGGGSGGSQSFVYTATGAETATFTLTLPSAQKNTKYIALAADGGRVDGTMSFFVCPVAQYTTTSIQVKCTQAPAAGDKILIDIVPTTS